MLLLYVHIYCNKILSAIEIAIYKTKDVKVMYNNNTKSLNIVTKIQYCICIIL